MAEAPLTDGRGTIRQSSDRPRQCPAQKQHGANARHDGQQRCHHDDNDQLLRQGLGLAVDLAHLRLLIGNGKIDQLLQPVVEILFNLGEIPSARQILPTGHDKFEE